MSHMADEARQQEGFPRAGVSCAAEALHFCFCFALSIAPWVRVSVLAYVVNGFLRPRCGYRKVQWLPAGFLEVYVWMGRSKGFLRTFL